MDKKNIIVIIVVIVAIIGVFYFMLSSLKKDQKSPITSQPYSTTDQINNQNTMDTNNVEGLKIEILTQGSGPEAKSQDRVTVNYTGTLEDGTIFDSSLKPGRTPFEFIIDQSQVIQGWHLGVIGMKLGEKRKLTISPELAYGKNGYPPVIPPSATLIFEIELLKIN